VSEFSPIKVKCLVSAEDRRGNMRSALSRGLPLALPQEAKAGRLAIVGSGPSVSQFVDVLRDWDGEICAVNWALKWLSERGIKPSSYVMCDADPAMLELARTLPSSVKYYVASVCHPTVFDYMSDKDVTLWHMGDPDVIPPSGSICIPGGTTVMARAPYLKYMLGHRDINLFGCDCSYGDETHVHGGALPPQAMPVACDGRIFLTEPVYMDAAAFLVSMVDRFPCPITLHGDGLAQTLYGSEKQNAAELLGEPRPEKEYFMRRRTA
jgi:hypothetical protein